MLKQQERSQHQTFYTQGDLSTAIDKGSLMNILFNPHPTFHSPMVLYKPMLWLGNKYVTIQIYNIGYKGFWISKLTLNLMDEISPKTIPPKKLLISSQMCVPHICYDPMTNFFFKSGYMFYPLNHFFNGTYKKIKTYFYFPPHFWFFLYLIFFLLFDQTIILY